MQYFAWSKFSMSLVHKKYFWFERSRIQAGTLTLPREVG